MAELTHRRNFADNIHPFASCIFIFMGKEQTFMGLIHSEKCSQFRYKSVTSAVEISIIKMVAMAQTGRPWVLPLSRPRCLKENQDHGKREHRNLLTQRTHLPLY